MIDTRSAKALLLDALGEFVPDIKCYYEKALSPCPTPYSVVKNIHISTLSDGDALTFDLEIHIDETKDTAETLETLCDEYRNAADGALLSNRMTIYGHINFNSQDDGSLESEYDLSRRTQNYTARLFYL